MKDCMYCIVKTLVVLFMVATTNRFGGESNNDDFDEDASDKSFVKHHFPKWDLWDTIKHSKEKIRLAQVS